jgi:single-strand DNA-binding protein
MNNLVVLSGVVTAEPVHRELPGGGVVLQFDLSDPDRGGSAVPVALHDPAPKLASLVAADARIVVVGSVRRRFFRVGGSTQSRTEVIADTVVASRRRRDVAAALHDAAERVLAM